ncbi:solute carrier family 22 member 6-like [Penaeus indicus]|uniref:solute carrier family 22 member 6-like n=1 Tax=Penaeus indicus TaxID=29960 RepID=UPI00300CD89C
MKRPLFEQQRDNHHIRIITTSQCGPGRRGGDIGIMSQLDDLLTQLGTGRWSILHILIFSYWFSLLSYHTLAGVFLAPKIDFTCRPPANRPHARTTNDSCAYFEEDSSTGFEEERPCTEWDFDNSTFSSTVTSEFGLVCEREYLRATYQSIYMLGIFVGAPLNGMMADR